MANLRDLIIRKSASIREAIKSIDKGASEIALVIDEKGKLVATITDGDIRRGLLKGFSLDDSVEKVMHKNFIYVKPETGRAEVLDLMKALSIKQIPILDEEGKIIGLHLLKEILGSYKKPNWALIMAGGKGERLKPLTEKIPKPMIKIAGRPILERLILHLVSYGIKNIFISINYLKEKIKEYFKDGGFLGCKINYLEEKRPLGTAGSISLFPKKPKDPFFVLNGDLVLQFDLEKMLNFHYKGNFFGTIGVYDNIFNIPYGVVEEKENLLQEIKEKPSITMTINAGVYIFNPEVLNELKKEEEISMVELFQKLLKKKKRLGVYHIEGDWNDIGMPEDLGKARGLK